MILVLNRGYNTKSFRLRLSHTRHAALIPVMLREVAVSISELEKSKPLSYMLQIPVHAARRNSDKVRGKIISVRNLTKNNLLIDK
jgi:hypothetical protein